MQLQPQITPSSCSIITTPLAYHYMISNEKA
uniref:Uncharacterized protein n=1 Tax=Rhizophora mucronata TaxID=61149 RepID=A0A2P2NNZ2_RHIMU